MKIHQAEQKNIAFNLTFFTFFLINRTANNSILHCLRICAHLFITHNHMYVIICVYKYTYHQILAFNISLCSVEKFVSHF